MFAKWYISLQIRKKIKIKFNNLPLGCDVSCCWVKWFVDPSVCVTYVCMFSISSLLFWSCETCKTARVWFCEIDASSLFCFEREALWTISCRCISCLSICEYKWSVSTLCFLQKSIYCLSLVLRPRERIVFPIDSRILFISCFFEFFGVIKKFSE